MVDSLKIEKLIHSCDEVFITAHKHIDLDALGSVLGVYYIANNFGKNVHIIVDDEEIFDDVDRAFSTMKKMEGIVPKKYDEVESLITSNSLLFITDTNKGERIQNEKLLKIKNKIVIDHHVESDTPISDLVYKYIDINSSSATEIVLQIIDDLNIYIPSCVATIMLAGIYIDTNGFLLKTKEKTHIYTSLLYKFGADNKEAQYLLKQDFNEFRRRQNLTLATKIYDKFAVSVCDMEYYSSELGKASDVILTFNNVEASFVIAKIEDDVVGISARSLGNVDVEKVMHHFNGGGHKTDAAAQIKGKSVEDVKCELLKFLGGLE